MTTKALIAKLYDNLIKLTPDGESHGTYVAYYLKYALENIVEHGVVSLESHVDYTTKRLVEHTHEQMLGEMDRLGV